MNPQKNIEERIELYLDGKLSKDEIEELWLDILNKPEYFTHLKINLSLRKRYRQKKEHPVVNTTNYQPWLLSVAAVVLFILAFNFFYTSIDETIVPLKQISFYELESSKVVRSDNQNLTKTDSLLNEAFNAVVTGEKNKGIDLYTQIYNKNVTASYSAKAHLNIGIIFYNELNFDDAAVSFRSALDAGGKIPRVEEKSHWFLAQTYINMNLLEKARDSARKTLEMNGKFKDEAQIILLSLDSILES